MRNNKNYSINSNSQFQKIIGYICSNLLCHSFVYDLLTVTSSAPLLRHVFYVLIRCTRITINDTFTFYTLLLVFFFHFYTNKQLTKILLIFLDLNSYVQRCKILLHINLVLNSYISFLKAPEIFTTNSIYVVKKLH